MNLHDILAIPPYITNAAEGWYGATGRVYMFRYISATRVLEYREYDHHDLRVWSPFSPEDIRQLTENTYYTDNRHPIPPTHMSAQ